MLIIYRTAGQLQAAIIALEAVSPNYSEKEVIRFNYARSFRSALSCFSLIAKYSISERKKYDSILFLLPYFGAFSFGHPIIEVVFRLFLNKSIVYYGDGFMVRGRKRHLWKSRLRISLCRILKINAIECYRYDFGYDPNFPKISTEIRVEIEWDSLQANSMKVLGAFSSYSVVLCNLIEARRLERSLLGSFYDDIKKSVTDQPIGRDVRFNIFLHPVDSNEVADFFSEQTDCTVMPVVPFEQLMDVISASDGVLFFSVGCWEAYRDYVDDYLGRCVLTLDDINLKQIYPGLQDLRFNSK